MATKTVKKKKTAKAAVKPAAVSRPSAIKAKKDDSSVVLFAPIANAIGSMASPNLCNFNQPVPAMDGTFESMETMMKNFKNQYENMSGDATASAREGLDSLTKSSASFAKGAEQMMKTLAEVAQESSQRNAEAVKALMACRTLNEYAEAQNKLVQENFDDAMSTMTKLSEMAIKLYTEALEPVNSQMTKAMSSAMKKSAA